MTVRYNHEAGGRVVSVSVHGEQTQSRLLEKTHQSNSNLRLSQNDNILMPKCEFKLAPNPNPNPARLGGSTRACVVNQA